MIYILKYVHGSSYTFLLALIIVNSFITETIPKLLVLSQATAITMKYERCSSPISDNEYQ